MGIIEVEIKVNTEELIENHPKGGWIQDPGKYIFMNIVGGKGHVSNITKEGTDELGFTADRDTYLRFFGRPTGDFGSVRLHPGGNIPRGRIVDDHFKYNEGIATAKTVNQTKGKVAYSFKIEIDNLGFTFEWDPFLGVK